MRFRQLPFSCLPSDSSGGQWRRRPDSADPQVKLLRCHDDRVKTSGFSVNTLESVMAGGERRGPAVIPNIPKRVR